jgi:enamine deaminase RidA (YjgF/YER057c/UK114 family)
MDGLIQLNGEVMPMGVRYGDLVYAAGLPTLEAMRAVLDEAGATLDNVARVTAYVERAEDREPVYPRWEAVFPDPSNRPAFKVLVGPRRRFDMLAVIGARRRRIDLPGVPARDPTVEIGPFRLTSRVHGTDPRTGKVAEDEARQALENIHALMPGELSQLTAFVRDPSLAHLVPEARCVVNVIPAHLSVMLEAISGPFQEIGEGVVLRDLVFVPAVNADGDGFEAQLRDGLARLEQVLGDATLAHLTVYMADLDDRPTLNRVWAERFPDPQDRPPHKYVPVPLPGSVRVQLQAFGVRGARREVLEIPGMQHGDPMSMGALVGGLLFSSRIWGLDPATGKTATEPSAQARLAFRNVKTLVQGRRLSQVTAFIGDDDESTARAAWEQAFREPRPRLRFVKVKLPGSTGVRLEVFGCSSSAP